VIADWTSYALADFIPFTPEVWFRLVERVNVAGWPLQFPGIALGLAALVLTWRGRPRLALTLLAPAWASAGVVFHLYHYAELSWAAVHFGAAFLAQAALLLTLARFGRMPDRRVERTPGTVVVAAVALFGLVAWPAMVLVTGHGWNRAEVFALHPDPTAVASLGVALLALRGLRAYVATLIPLLWLGVSTLTLVALQLPWAWVLPCLVVVALAGAVVVSRSGHGRRGAVP
jgi:hypothetical protein